MQPCLGGGGVCEGESSPSQQFFCRPNRNYVFQRRYVRFDGKNLMYFSSEKVPRGRVGQGCTSTPPGELPHPLCLPLAFWKEPAVLERSSRGPGRLPTQPQP